MTPSATKQLKKLKKPELQQLVRKNGGNPTGKTKDQLIRELRAQKGRWKKSAITLFLALIASGGYSYKNSMRLQSLVDASISKSKQVLNDSLKKSRDIKNKLLSRLQTIGGQIRKMRKKIKKYMKTNYQQKKEIEHLKSEVERIELEKNMLYKTYQKLTKDHEDLKWNSDDKLAKLQEELEKLQKELKKHKSDISTLKQTNLELMDNLTKANDINDQFETEKKTQEEQIQQLTAELTELKEIKQSIISKKEELQRALNARGGDVTKINELEKQIDEDQTAFEQKQQKDQTLLSQRREIIEQLNHSLSVSEGKLEDLHKDNAHSQLVISTKDTEIQQLRSQIEQFETQMSKVYERYGHIFTMTDKLETSRTPVVRKNTKTPKKTAKRSTSA